MSYTLLKVKMELDCKDPALQEYVPESNSGIACLIFKNLFRVNFIRLEYVIIVPFFNQLISRNNTPRVGHLSSTVVPGKMAADMPIVSFTRLSLSS
jgi:hypothetical protein